MSQQSSSSKTVVFMDDDLGIPLPNDFTNFYPWACGQFQLGADVIIRKMIQSEFVGTNVQVNKINKMRVKNPMQAHISRMEIVSEADLAARGNNGLYPADPVVIITAICNLSDKLTHIKFEKSNFTITRMMIVILGLFVQFHPYLIAFTIKNKVDKLVIYELEKVIAMSNIVEVYLDGCYVREANFDILLSEKCALRILSLSRCSLTDEVVKTLMEKLDHLSAASMYLYILNLASNRITDVGAKYIAQALRSNRHLSYLNLAGNEITDEGVFAILDTMREFPITEEELVPARGRRFQYLSDRIEMVNRLVYDITEEEFEKIRRKHLKAGNRALLPRMSRVAFPTDVIRRIHDRAELQADVNLGKFMDPFFPLSTKNDVVYCYGNHTLQSLNIAYNNLTILSVRKFLEVLKFQQAINRKPRGLVNINIEGNLLPLKCPELGDINILLEQVACAEQNTRGGSMYPKKPRTKLVMI